MLGYSSKLSSSCIISEDVDGIFSSDPNTFRTKVRRVFVGTSWDFWGNFSVGILPVTKLFRFGSLRKVI